MMKKKSIFYSITFILSFFLMATTAKCGNWDGFNMKCSYVSEDRESAYNFVIQYNGGKWNIGSTWKTEGTITKYKGTNTSNKESATIQNEQFVSGVCPSHAYIIKQAAWGYSVGTGDQTYVTEHAKEYNNHVILKLANDYNTNKANMDMYQNLESKTTCSYDFGDKKVNVKIPTAWYGAVYNLTGGAGSGGKIIPEGTCPDNVYYICKKGDLNSCSYSLSLSRPSICSEGDYKCYQLPDKNPLDEEKEPDIRQYTKEYSILQRGNIFLGEKLTFDVSYDHNNSMYTQTRLNSSESSKIDVAYNGTLTAFTADVLDLIAKRKTFPEKIYCAKLDENVKLNTSAIYVLGNGNGDAVCSPRKDTFLGSGQLTVYSTEGGNIGEQTGENSNTDPEYSTSKRTCVTCGNGTLKDIPSQLPLFIRNCVKFFQLMIPVILIIVGIIDFVRAVIANDEKIMAESQKRFIRRTTGGVLFFFVVAIVRFVFGLIDGNVNVLGCVPCFISDSGSCGEEYTCPDRKSISTDINSGDESSTTHTSSGSSTGSASSAATSATITLSGCSAYATQNECSRPSAENTGCLWNSITNKCVKGTGNTISASDCVSSGYKVVSDSSAPGGFRCVKK